MDPWSNIQTFSCFSVKSDKPVKFLPYAIRAAYYGSSHPEVFLRRFYTRRNVSGMSRRHRFFCSCTCVKVLFTETFLKCRFRWKVEIILTFTLRTNVAFFLSQLFLCIHVNKVSHYKYGLFTVHNVAQKLNGCVLQLGKREISKWLLVLTIFPWYWITKKDLC